VLLSEFLARIGADTRAKYVWFQCAEGYSNTIDMATALHPQTQLSFKFDNQILPRKYGFPMKCRIPTKLGFKNPKYVTALYVQNNDAGGYWENQGYNWFSGS
jgi:DMSO/TMAO reductase YedYZ molybdopterin-dependent catalytic subunit